MNRARCSCLTALFICLTLAAPTRAQYTILHSFAGGSSDGNVGNTSGLSLALSGSVLYGTTYSGGTSNMGAIFKINTDGSGFSLLHSFAGGTADGREPFAGLTLVGSTLFGTTAS